MEDYTTKRTATILIQKYGKKALPKAVEVAKYYLTERDDENAKRWVSIGYEIKHMLKIYSIKEILSMESDELEKEEA
jgi:hypothetical protein